MTDGDGSTRAPSGDRSVAGNGGADASDGTEERSRERRYTLSALADYVWHNRWKVLRDGVAALLVVVVVAVAFAQTGLPAWTFYVFLFLALMLYTRLVEPWQWPGEGGRGQS